MYTYLLWFLLLLPIPTAITVFLLCSKKSLLRGYLLGLLPIFLFWQIVSILTLSGADQPQDQPRRESYYGLLVMLFYGYLLVVLIYYTGWSLSLRWAYRGVIRWAHIRRPIEQVAIATGLAVLLGICWAIGLTAVFLFIAFINSVLGGGLGRDWLEYMLIIPLWLHAPVIKYGLWFFVWLDGALLLLISIWLLTRPVWQRRRKLARG